MRRTRANIREAGWLRPTATLAVVALVATVIAAMVAWPGTARAWDISASCDENGDIVGTITVSPVPNTFDIWVTDHKPGEGSLWVEIPGSRQTVIANSSTVNFGPLDVSQARSGINSMRVEQSATNEKSESFLCPPRTHTPTPTNTPTVVVRALPPTGTATHDSGFYWPTVAGVLAALAGASLIYGGIHLRSRQDRRQRGG